MKKEMVCKTPYCIHKQASMYRVNSVNNHVIPHFPKPLLISFGRCVMRIWVSMIQLAGIGLIIDFFDCLEFSTHTRIFHSFQVVTFADEGLQILIYTWHVWLLSSESSLACHAYCDTGHKFHLYWSSPRTRDTPTLCRAFGSGVVTTCFNDLCRGWDSNTQPSACGVKALNHCAITASFIVNVFKSTSVAIPLQ